METHFGNVFDWLPSMASRQSGKLKITGDHSRSLGSLVKIISVAITIGDYDSPGAFDQHPAATVDQE
eukprot:Skav223819  [mRNA]  locus=scaffold3121:16861:17061:- [translate_table: standard]